MRTVMLAGLWLIPAGPAPAQEPARAVVERAIQAHGGREKLARVRADRVRLRGNLHVGTNVVPFLNETTVQLPGQFKSVVLLTVAGRTQTVVHLLDGDRAQVLVDGRLQEMSSSQLAQLRQTLQIDQAVRLVPLLTEGDFRLEPLGEVSLLGKQAQGVRVTGRGQKDVRLYFDKQTGLLLKAEHALDGPGGKDLKQEIYYAEFRDEGGYKRAGRVAAYRDGVKVMEAELLSVKTFDHLEREEFTQP